MDIVFDNENTLNANGYVYYASSGAFDNKLLG